MSICFWWILFFLVALPSDFAIKICFYPKKCVYSGIAREACEELRPVLSQSNYRLRDLLFLEIALDSCIRTAIERGYEELNSAKPEVYHPVSMSVYV